MKTIAKYILAIGILFLAASCESPLLTKDASDADMVEVTMSVAFPEPVAINTKAPMGEGPTADEAFDIYLCVYGPGDGYVQNWIKPLEVTKVDSNTDGYVDKGTFKVLLPISEDKRTIHIIANPPASVVPTTSDYIDNVMEKMVTEGGECAYWQQIELNKIDAGSTTGTTGYPLASEYVKGAFTNVHLVRNFAKVVVTKDPTAPFVVKRWTLINVPDRAYIAPYTGNKAKRFPDGYLNIKDYTAVGALYTQLRSATGDNYPGSIPPEAVINKEFPGDPGTYPTKYAEGVAKYLYERPVPENAGEQTAVLVEVTFDEGHNPGSRTDRTYWYKIEVIDKGGEYIPMFRDIVYTLKLKDLQAEGAATALAAYNGPYFGNISASLETASLNELSDTESLIHVDVMDYTFMGALGGSTVLLKIDPADETSPAAQYWFIPDVVNHPDEIFKTSTTNKCDIKVELLTASGYAPAVETGTLVANDGTITIKLNPASATAIKRSIIRVSGRPGNDVVSNTKKYLYREITITLMEKQDLTVTVTPPTDTDDDPTNDKTGADKPVKFNVELPEGLSASVFPVQLRIEAEQNSLCAYSPDLPASTGPSEFTSKAGKNTYFFVYTINFSDYRYLDPVTKKYEYNYEYDFTMYTSKSGDNSTAIKIRDLGGKFNTADVAL